MRSRSHRPARRRGGFTLIEVLLVLAILGVIAAMVVPNLIGRQDDANRNAAKLSIQQIENTVKLYAADHKGRYPQGGQEVLTQLSQPEQLTTGRTREPYLEESSAQDPWGNQFFYQFPSNHGLSRPDIWSAGPDGKNDSGSGDDIANWHEEI